MGVKKHLTVLVLMGFALLGSGCSVSPINSMADEYESSRPIYVSAVPKATGAIFQSGYEMTLFEDIRARRVGDIITIILNEQMNASKDASTSTSKDTSVEMANPTLLGLQPSFDIPLPFGRTLRDRNLALSIASGSSFAGAGDTSQSNSLSGSVTVTVSEVLPNGNLVVRGQKRLTINQGDEYVQVYGIVRPADINPDNTIMSSKVADAKFSYVGEGTLANANTQGWLARFFNTKWWPF